MDIQGILNTWSQAYCNTSDCGWVTFIGFDTKMCKGATVAGRCYYQSGGKSKIYLNEKLIDHGFWTKIALWHEFCHAWAYKDGDDPDDWNRPLLSRIMKKPVYFFAQFALALAWICL